MSLGCYPSCVPHKNPEERKQYLKDYRRRRKAAAPQIKCACGCGEEISAWDGNGQLRKFVFGHKAPLPEGHVPKRVAEAPDILCACGCGKSLKAYNQHGNKQRFIYGHSANRCLPDTPAPLSFKASASRKNQATRKNRWARKMVILRHYGGEHPECACCGEGGVVFLALDHIDGGGNTHRKEIKSKGGHTFYLWIVNNNFPKGFRVLCHNCNMAIGILGYCPHRPPSNFERWVQERG